ncbi:MAG TPA: DUF309 domain-containing protein [Bacteroidota bacterium]|nr:DUF309 domain-containing protein [Bacteroidota bacterium]
MEDLFRKGVAEFNRRSFFEAHDTWEELWRESSGENRLFYQGLIQTAVGLYHLTNGNVRGASSQFGKALAKLEQYLPTFHGVDTQHLVSQVHQCLSLAVHLQAGSVTTPDPSAIPDIRLFCNGF